MPTSASKKITALPLDPYQTIREGLALLIKKSITEAFDTKIVVDPSLIAPPPNPELGDLALGCFSFAKILGKAPNIIAHDIAHAATKLINGKESSIVTIITADGPYVNFKLNSQGLAALVLTSAGEKKYGESMIGQHKPIVLEYVSPNTNKPLHLGHVRNGLLGVSLAHLLESTGYKVKKTMLVNDRGIHICKSMVAYQRMEKDNSHAVTPETEDKKGDHLVGEYYVAFETIFQKDETILDEAQACLRKWEEGDKQTKALWKKMNSWVLKGHAQTFKTLGLAFDKTYLESAIYTEGRDLIMKGLKKGTVQKDETGAVYADLTAQNLPNKILLRQDGTALYITQDLYLVALKQKDFHPVKSIYVIGSEQDLYLKQLFTVAGLLGVAKPESLYHLSYGMVNLTEGRMKSREGTVVDADDLLAELTILVKEEITSREERLSEKTLEQRAHVIASAALKYYFLDVGPKSPITYNPKESIAFQGRTGPYLLYTYARLRSIIKKSGTTPKWTKSLASYDWEAERALVLVLATFPTIVRAAAAEYNPSLVAKYLYELAKIASTLYHELPILKASPTERTARLLLMADTAEVLKKGLSLLSIDTLETM